MEITRIILKIVMWILIAEFGCNFIMQTISYSFYKGAKKMTDISCTPQFIQMTDELTGYGYNLDVVSDKVILFFGGPNNNIHNLKLLLWDIVMELVWLHILQALDSAKL